MAFGHWLSCRWRGARCAHGAGKGREGGTAQTGKKKKKSELQPVESHKAFIFMTLFFLCRAGHFFFRNFFFFLGCCVCCCSPLEHHVSWDTHGIPCMQHAIPFLLMNFISFGRHLFFFLKKKEKTDQ